MKYAKIINGKIAELGEGFFIPEGWIELAEDQYQS
jgi:hypothetical protein